MKPIDEQTILTDAVAIADKRVRAAAATQRLADAEALRPVRRLSAKAWRDAALKQAGHDAALIETLRNVLTTRGAQFAGVLAYVHAIGASIREHEWRGIQSTLAAAPHTWRASRADAEQEIALVGVSGANLWSLVALAIADLAASDPEAFGDVDDPAEDARQREAVKAHADAALRTLAATPPVLLLGMAVERGVAVEPLANLPARLVADLLNDAPRSAPRPRAVEGAQLLGRA